MPNYQKIRTGVIGVGSMGQNHIRIYNEISDLVGITDIDSKTGSYLAKKWGVPFYDNLDDLLENVDAVTIATPTFAHCNIAEKVASKGVHALIEKPLALSTDESKQIIQAFEKNNLVLSVGHIERHNPVINVAKEKLQNGSWGRLITMTSKRVSRYPKRIKDVGVVFDIAIHDLDIVRFLASSEARKIYAIGGRIEYPDKEDHVSILMEFGNGIKAFCESNWLTPLKVRKLNLICTKAYVLLDYTNQTIEVYNSNFVNIDNSNLWNVEQNINKESIEIIKEEPLRLELLDFLKSVSNPSEYKPLVSGNDGLQAVQLAESVVQKISEQ